jgi:hypothetical protein
VRDELADGRDGALLDLLVDVVRLQAGEEGTVHRGYVAGGVIVLGWSWCMCVWGCGVDDGGGGVGVSCKRGDVGMYV